MKTMFFKYLSILPMLFLFLIGQTPDVQAGPLSEYTIICGSEPACPTDTKSCWECTFSSRSAWTLWLKKSVSKKYICSASAPSGLDHLDGCSNTSGRGGKTGDSYDEVLGFRYNEEAGYNCIPQNLKNMYKICYPCVIVGTLVSSFTTAAGKTYDIVRQLANVILTIATVLWLAMYVLKNISSFTTAEPMKMIQDILIQLFKVLVAYVVVNAGIDVIVHYMIEPILNTGTDFGIAILDTLGGEHA